MKRILIVDDEPSYRETIGSVLRQSGYLVCEAEDGDKAIDLAQSAQPDVIISDVMMERLDGFGLLGRLRMDPTTSMIPFIFTTGLSDKDSMRKGMSLGADDFLVKPFSSAELLSAIDTRLAMRDELRQEVEKRLSQLRSCISLALPHEIRTPLASIIGFADVLADEASVLSYEEVMESGKLVKKAGMRLRHLLENFMVYSQIEIVATDPERLAAFKRAQLPHTSDLIEELSRIKADSWGRSSDLVLDLSPCPAAISQLYLKKIGDELVDNAFKFSEIGTRVEVRACREGNSFVLSVADSGRGMNREQVASLGAYVQFERAYHEQQGTGLGLSIAKRLTEMHGGKMEFEANFGAGLIVRAIIPLPPE
ncbi:MAG: hybrid sensor histidine kinase/response regulator [Ignavibacteriales bacterium]|nr:hybrid sensor histidine kinase/response regulator [Ignavibacteriales bacterium]